MLKYDKYQKNVFSTLANGKGNVIIKAVAGSGKTTTIKRCMDLIPKDSDSIYIAFNNGIVKEMKEAMPDVKTTISTMHSFCWRAIMKTTRGKAKLNKSKSYKHIEKVLKKKQIETEKEAYYFYMISNMVDLMRHNLVSDVSGMKMIADRFEFSIGDLEIEMISEVMILMNKDKREYDFTDMIYRVIFDNVKLPKYDYIFIDESQDLSIIQQEILKRIKKKDGRMIAVGDPHQCQPDGTKVLLSDGTEKNIEEIKVGDSVLTYDNNGCFKGWNFQNKQSTGSIVEEVKRRRIVENLIEIKSNDKITKYTKNHKCIVRFNKEKIEKSYTLYLMQKDDFSFRIGITKTKRKDGFGLHTRFKGENADNIWILKICKDRNEASFFEQFYSVKFGMPQLCFTPPRIETTKGYFNSQESFDKFYEELKPILLKRAIKCLKYFGRDLRYPILKKGEKNRFSCFGMFEIFASNVIEDVMQVKHFTGDNKGVWIDIDSVKNIEFNGYVTSLKVNKYERYVADNILTHNSIYGFAGADSNSYNNLKKLFINTTELPLSYNYRCGRNIITEAQNINPEIQAWKGAKNGIVREGVVGEIKNGDWVLCRNVKPLVMMNLYLLGEGTKSYIKGFDIGIGLIQLIRKTGKRTTKTILEEYQKEIFREIVKMKRKGVRNPRNTEKIDSMNQKQEILKILCKNLNTSEQLTDKIKSIFKESGTGVVLSTIHKAKGQENDRIFFLLPKLIPNQYATQPWQLEQEMNLMYVGITRAKNALIYINEDEFKIVKETLEE